MLLSDVRIDCGVMCCRQQLYTSVRSQRLTQLIIDEEARKLEEKPASVKQSLQRLVRVHD